jgi:hypothetical protein
MTTADQPEEIAFRFSIDRGGTFCDVYCQYTVASGGQHEEVEKLLSVCPEAYADAPTEGIRRVLRRVYARHGHDALAAALAWVWLVCFVIIVLGHLSWLTFF